MLSVLALQSFSGCSSHFLAIGNGSALVGSLEVQHKLDQESLEPLNGKFNCVEYTLPSPILPLERSEFAMLRKLSASEFTLGRIDDSLDLVWSAPIHCDTLGYQTALFRLERNICVVMTEFTGHDTVKAVAYLVDPATGRLLSTRIIDARPGNTSWLGSVPKGFGPYTLEFSPDSSKILLANTDFTDYAEFSLRVRRTALILDRKLDLLYRTVLTADSRDAINDRYYGVIPANDGSVVQVIRREPDMIEVSRAFPPDGHQSTVQFVLSGAHDAAHPYEIASDAAFGTTSNGDAIVAIGYLMPGTTRLAGMGLLKFPATGAPPALIVNDMFGDDVAETMVSEDYFEDYRIKSVDLTVNNRMLIFPEQSSHGQEIMSHFSSDLRQSYSTKFSGDGTPDIRWDLPNQASGRTITKEAYFNDCGPLTVFAFDSSASNRWRSAFMKRRHVVEQSFYLENGYCRWCDRSGNLQIVYMNRENNGLIWGTLNIGDGRIQRVHTPLTFDKKATFLRSYTTWLNDSTLIIAGTKDLNSGRMVLYKVQSEAPHAE